MGSETRVYHVETDVQVLFDPNDFPGTSSPLANLMTHLGKGIFNSKCLADLNDIWKDAFTTDNEYSDLVYDVYAEFKDVYSRHLFDRGVFRDVFFNYESIAASKGEMNLESEVLYYGGQFDAIIEDLFKDLLGEKFLSAFIPSISQMQNQWKQDTDKIKAQINEINELVPRFDEKKLRNAVKESLEKVFHVSIREKTWMNSETSSAKKVDEITHEIWRQILGKRPDPELPVRLQSILAKAESNFMSTVNYLYTFQGSKRLRLVKKEFIHEFGDNWKSTCDKEHQSDFCISQSLMIFEPLYSNFRNLDNFIAHSKYSS